MWADMYNTLFKVFKYNNKEEILEYRTNGDVVYKVYDTRFMKVWHIVKKLLTDKRLKGLEICDIKVRTDHVRFEIIKTKGE